MQCKGMISSSTLELNGPLGNTLKLMEKVEDIGPLMSKLSILEFNQLPLPKKLNGGSLIRISKSWGSHPQLSQLIETLAS